MINLSSLEQSVLKSHALFLDLTDEDFKNALSLYEASEKAYYKDEFIKLPGSCFTSFGLVLNGSVFVYSDDLEANPMLMAHVSQGNTFGEALCFLEKEAEIYVKAASDCKILWLNPRSVALRKGALETLLFHRFTEVLAERTLQMNERIQILSKKTIREKLLTFFSEVSQKKGLCFDISLNRNNLALYLGTDRAALCRELSRMKSEGLIDYEGNSFRILL